MNRGHCGQTAQELGVHRNTLMRMMQDLRISKSEVRATLKKMPRGARQPAAERKVSA
jgi:DNA-binding PucR family transcriptional regulator